MKLVFRPFLAVAALVARFSLTATAADPQEVIQRHFGSYAGGMTVQGKELQVRFNPEACAQPDSPCSTYKIPNTLIGLETGVITGADFQIKWDGVKRPVEAWNSDQTLAQAYKNSTVWFYQEVARRVGAERMQNWIDRFDYGNRDIRGGIDQFWLGSSLQISADQQLSFLQKVKERTLPLQPATYTTARQVMELDRRHGKILFGKTGTNGSLATGNFTLGWFVGWVEDEQTGEPIYFATRLVGGENPGGKEARRITEAVLADLGHWPAP